ncbi:MAG: transporter ATP-binding protein, partial [Thermoleophilia bacterium]|nr:transporter ATP-binding protein [Thermoleophilia bacterium]
LPPHKRNLGMLFQNYALFPHMTVAQNIGYPLRERKVPKTEIAQRVSAVLELVQLTGRDTNYPAQLSGGQQQRVALARAIVFNPSALLLDEPLGALDRNLRATLQLEIRRIHRELGATFVFVTHDQEEAMNLSDRIALFKDGHIEQVGSPLDLYNAPRTLFAATFIGDSTVLRLPSFSGLTELAWEGHSLRGFPGTISESVKTGAPAAVIVRPESLSVARAGESVPVDANTVTGSVRDVEFMGGYRTVILSLANGAASGRARVAAADTRFAVGDPVTAWWMPVEQRIVAV